MSELSDNQTDVGNQVAKPSQTVSFGDLDGQERARRFTISAHPSTQNIPTQPLDAMGQSRKSSSTGKTISDFLHSSLANGVGSTNEHQATDSEKSPVVRSSVENVNFQEKITSGETSPRRTVHTSSPSPSDSQPTQPINISSSGPSRRGSMKRSNKTVVASPSGPPVPFQEYLSREDDGKFHILLACTGSVATIKVPQIIDKLFQLFGTSKISIQLVVTRASGHFLKGLKLHNEVKIWRDEDEWANYNHVMKNSLACSNVNQNNLSVNKKPKNPYEKMILHNELRKWADIMLIAPLSANTLAKISNGLADNLLTSIVRSWGQAPTLTVKKPILVAPAMNTLMYTHPITAKQLAIISSQEEGFGIEILKPVEKVLVCGDIGMGGMREWSDIVDILRRKVNFLKIERARGEDGNVDKNTIMKEVEEEEEEEEKQEEEYEDEEEEEGGEEEDDDDEDDYDDEDEEDEEDDEEEDDDNDEQGEGKETEGREKNKFQSEESKSLNGIVDYGRGRSIEGEDSELGSARGNHRTKDSDEMIFEITDGMNERNGD
ncbi:uncharacterized protein PRCAT00001187001 [Priceomyces carsonii]|uniref:uncharacterized protein n=1 Tax=Priceomyces carsonii TaxID=28549 RepID=UPI002EDA5C41|nr:unnamed protein product [Priceomyces carsonii]